MPEKDSRHLLDRLAEIHDPRNDKGKRHPLNSILLFNIIGFMSGHKGWTSTAYWTQSQPDLVKALDWTHKNSPCPATIHNDLKVLDADAVEKTFTNWGEDVCKSRTDLDGCLDVGTIDGPTIQSRQKSGATTSNRYSVVSLELGLH